MTMHPIRVTYDQACDLLSIKRNALRELTLKDPTFPKSYKAYESRQAPAYFDYAELVAWHNNQKSCLSDGNTKVDLSHEDLRKLIAKDTRHNQTTNTILVYMRSPRNSLLASLHLILKITSCIIKIVRMCFLV